MIYDFLKKYAGSLPSRFHTPGHLGTLERYDITELTSGEFPADYIKNAENSVAEVFGSKEARLLTNGSSMGIKATLLALDAPCLAERGAHQAIEEAQELVKKPLYYFDDIYSALEKHPDAKTVVLESPNYFGETVPLEVIRFIKSKQKTLYIDAAHGAHFVVGKPLFDNSQFAFADFYNLSAHKTLNAYTGTAYLCINNLALVSKIDHSLKLLGTTSPNYLLLAQLEKAALEVRKSKKEYQKLFLEVEKFKKQIHCRKNDDFTRIVIDAEKNGFSSGERLNNRLIENNIYPEKVVDGSVVLITTPSTTAKQFRELVDAIKR